jgi:hypothetical protein
LYSRLKRPLLTAVVSGALIATGAVYSAPANAAAPVSGVLAADPSEGTTPSAEPTTTTAPPAPTTSASETASAEPSASVTESASPSETTSTSATPSPSESTTTADPEPSDSTSPPPPADTVAPHGKFGLNTFTLWVGQRVTLTQVGVGDDHSTPAQISRVVSWGDGTTSVLSATQGSITKQYKTAGHRPITLTLKDQAGNASVARSSGVNVTNPGHFKLSKSAVWHHENFQVSFSSVPAGTTKIAFYTADGRTLVLKGRSQTITRSYLNDSAGRLVAPGVKWLTAVYYNKFGATTPLAVGAVSLRADRSGPSVRITKPAHSERVSSWKYVRGTATDKGSGVRDLFVIALKGTSSTVYCYTAKKTWKRIRTDADFNYCGQHVAISKGKWSLRLTGLGKGYFTVIAVGADWSGNLSNTAEIDKKLTR